MYSILEFLLIIITLISLYFLINFFVISPEIDRNKARLDYFIGKEHQVKVYSLKQQFSNNLKINNKNFFLGQSNTYISGQTVENYSVFIKNDEGYQKYYIPYNVTIIEDDELTNTGLYKWNETCWDNEYFKKCDINVKQNQKLYVPKNTIILDMQPVS